MSEDKEGLSEPLDRIDRIVDEAEEKARQDGSIDDLPEGSATTDMAEAASTDGAPAQPPDSGLRQQLVLGPDTQSHDLGIEVHAGYGEVGLEFKISGLQPMSIGLDPITASKLGQALKKKAEEAIRRGGIIKGKS